MATNKVGAGSTLFIPNKASPDPPTAASYGVDARTTEEWAQQTLGTIGGIQAAILELDTEVATINSEITVIDGTIATLGTEVTTIGTEITALQQTTGDLTTDYQVGTAPPSGTRLTDAVRSRTATATFGVISLAITGFSYGYCVICSPGNASQCDSVAMIVGGSSTLTTLQFYVKLNGTALNGVPCTVNYRITGA